MYAVYIYMCVHVFIMRFRILKDSLEHAQKLLLDVLGSLDAVPDAGETRWPWHGRGGGDERLELAVLSRDSMTQRWFRMLRR